MKKVLSSKAFTLIEILLVVAAIAILAGIVILAVNPGKQLGDTRNAQRRADVNTILNAVYQYSIDNNVSFADIINTSETEICRTGGNCVNLVDFSILTTGEKYLTSLPVDPTGSTTNGTGYNAQLTTNGRIVITAPNAEQGATISVTR